jgi:N-acetylneuraminic acid mutarotase
VQEHAVVPWRDGFCLLGGFVGGLSITDAVRCYDAGTDAWTELAPLPVAAHHVNAAVVAGRIYVLGMLVGNANAFGDLYIYDPEVEAWSKGDAMAIDRARGGSGIAVVGGLIYVVGGLRNGQAQAQVDVYDPAFDQWEDLPDLPEVRDHMVAVRLGERLFVAGGRNVEIGAHTDRVHVWDPSRPRWEEAAPMPTSRAGMAAAALGGRLYVVGGEGNEAEPSGVFAATEVYDPVEDRWAQLEPMPTPRHGMGAASNEERGLIWVPGGAVQQGFGASDLVGVFVP